MMARPRCIASSPPCGEVAVSFDTMDKAQVVQPS